MPIGVRAMGGLWSRTSQESVSTVFCSTVVLGDSGLWGLIMMTTITSNVTTSRIHPFDIPLGELNTSCEPDFLDFMVVYALAVLFMSSYSILPYETSTIKDDTLS